MLVDVISEADEECKEDKVDEPDEVALHKVLRLNAEYKEKGDEVKEKATENPNEELLN